MGEIKKDCPYRKGDKCANGLWCNQKKLFSNMSFIIFENWPDTNWMDKTWAKAKYEENQQKELMLIEDSLPMASTKRKAQIMGISTGHYYQLRIKYKIKETS